MEEHTPLHVQVKAFRLTLLAHTPAARDQTAGQLALPSCFAILALSLLLMSSFLLLPAVLVKERACSPGVVLGPDVHVWVLRALMFMVMRMGKVPDGHAYAQRDSCMPKSCVSADESGLNALYEGLRSSMWPGRIYSILYLTALQARI